MFWGRTVVECRAGNFEKEALNHTFCASDEVRIAGYRQDRSFWYSGCEACHSNVRSVRPWISERKILISIRERPTAQRLVSRTNSFHTTVLVPGDSSNHGSI